MGYFVEECKLALILFFCLFFKHSVVFNSSLAYVSQLINSFREILFLFLSNYLFLVFLFFGYNFWWQCFSQWPGVQI